MRNCFIPGCDQLCRGVAKRRMFSAPKNEECFQAWVAVLPKNRTFKSHDKVCDRHFNKDDIYTTYDNVINGLVYKIERGRPRLRLKAIPCRNLYSENVPTSRRTQAGKKAKIPAAPEQIKSIISVHPRKVKEEMIVVHEEQHLEVVEVNEVHEISSEECSSATADSAAVIPPESALPVEEEHLESIEISEVHVQELFDSLYDDIYEVVLPNTLWGVHRCPERSSIFFSYVDPNGLRTTKMIAINSQGQAKILMGSRVMNEQNLVVDINSAEALSDMIAQVDEMKLCYRVYDNEFCEVTLKDDTDVCASCAQSETQ